MSSKPYPLPEVVDLNSAKSVAADLMRHVDTATQPAVSTAGLRQAGVPLLQILVAARTHAEGQGKSFTVEADRDGAFARLLTTYAVDPVLCGAPAELLSPAPAYSTKRT
jgi:hypothetical protein